MTREIDRICTWMGWEKQSFATAGRNTGEWYTGDGTAGTFKARSWFDPFTNPSDCARVMDEVVKTHDVQVTTMHTEDGIRYEVGLRGMGKHVWPTVVTYGTESEAKMNAVLAMIEGA